MVIATLVGLLAIFVMLSIALGIEDSHDPRSSRTDELPFWIRYGHR